MRGISVEYPQLEPPPKGSCDSSDAPELSDEEVVEMHGRFIDSYTNICNMLTSGCALSATDSRVVDVYVYGFVQAIGEYADILTDDLLDEQDPLASKVLTRRIDESAQWLYTIAALRGVVLKPHTNRIAWLRGAIDSMMVGAGA